MGSLFSRKISSFIPTDLRARLEREKDRRDSLSALWRAAAGEELGRYFRPYRFEDGTLYLQTPSPAWASRLRHRRFSLVEALRAAPGFSGLKKVQVRVRPEPPMGTDRGGRRRRSAVLSRNSARVIREAAKTLGDRELREALGRLTKAARE